MELVREGVETGARRHKACEILGVSVRTLQRWEENPEEGDRRSGPKSQPSNSLSEPEKDLVVAVANSPWFRDVFTGSDSADFGGEGCVYRL